METTLTTCFTGARRVMGLVVLVLVGGCAAEPQVPTAVHVVPASLVVNDVDADFELTAIVTDQTGHPMTDVEVTWTSRDPTVATMDGAESIGVVRPAGDGSTIVEAHAGSLRGTASVTIQVTRSVLLKVYDELGGPGWTSSTHWGTDAPLGDWHGVETNAGGEVVGLNLNRNGLVGTIPPEISLLKELTYLKLFSGDSVTGHIPPELGKLRNLRSLVLSDNQLTGPIPPELGSLAALQSFSVVANQLTGPVPPELGNLRELGVLNLSINLMSGPLPRELTGLPLQWFYWNETDLCAPRDAEFREWLQSIWEHRGGDTCSG